MKRFGVLPEDLDPTVRPIDVYRTDRDYWSLFGWDPDRNRQGITAPLSPPEAG
jgi:hypothetical protein